MPPLLQSQVNEPGTPAAALEITGACLGLSIRRRTSGTRHALVEGQEGIPTGAVRIQEEKFPIEVWEHRKAKASHYQGRGSPKSRSCRACRWKADTVV